jgi:hypothetical protein
VAVREPATERLEKGLRALKGHRVARSRYDSELCCRTDRCDHLLRDPSELLVRTTDDDQDGDRVFGELVEAGPEVVLCTDSEHIERVREAARGVLPAGLEVRGPLVEPSKERLGEPVGEEGLEVSALSEAVSQLVICLPPGLTLLRVGDSWARADEDQRLDEAGMADPELQAGAASEGVSDIGCPPARLAEQLRCVLETADADVSGASVTRQVDAEDLVGGRQGLEVGREAGSVLGEAVDKDESSAAASVIDSKSCGWA